MFTGLGAPDDKVFVQPVGQNDVDHIHFFIIPDVIKIIVTVAAALFDAILPGYFFQFFGTTTYQSNQF